MPNQTELHNRLAGQIVASIVRPPLQAGGTVLDVMVLFESVVVGVSLAVIKLGGDDAVLDVVLDRARERLAEIRLTPIKPQGSA